MSVRKYLFIDGANFESTLQALDPCHRPEFMSCIDFNQLTKSYDKAYYYDSLPVKKPKENQINFDSILARKKILFSNINRTAGCHVQTGVSRIKPERASSREQKGVDVLMAIDIIQQAYQRNMEEAHIFTSDLDMYPLLEALKFTRVTSYLYYGFGRTSEDLIESADVSIPITMSMVHDWLEPNYRDPFSTQTGRGLDNRPNDMNPELFEGVFSREDYRSMSGLTAQMFELKCGKWYGFEGQYDNWVLGNSIEAVKNFFDHLPKWKP